tara:strand:- start:3545 stop:7525 length:3981 start_codon:yes stop_codon:yes gene_type:complete
MGFLEKYELNSIPLNLQIVDLKPTSLFLGEGSQPLEIAVFSSSKKPTTAKAQEAFKKRRAKRAAAVLIVITHPEGVTLCGTSGEQPPIYYLKDQDQVERLCVISLKKSNKNESIKFLTDSIPSLETNLPGILNEGFLSNHELENGVQKRKDWSKAFEKSNSIIENHEANILYELGFISKKLDNLTDLLFIEEEKIAVKISLEEGEFPKVINNRFNNISPISYGFNKALNLNIPWVLILFRNGIRLYSTKNIGVARRSRSETYIECQPYLLSKSNKGLLWLLFSSDALKKGGTIFDIIDNSKRFFIDIAEKLRERIYEKVIPLLAIAISNHRQIINPSKKDIMLSYEMAVTVLFRLLFISYAEDRDFLPYKSNENYRKNSLKQKAKELAISSSSKITTGTAYDQWNETTKLWQAISAGNIEWGIPAYGGKMFSNDVQISQAGAALSKISIPNDPFEEILRNLLLTESHETNFVPIDFRSLSVREFGTIYEGLLESELSLAEDDLMIDKKGAYLPVQDKEKIVIKKGEIYLHDKSGSRKSSGSFFTPEFLVDYLLDQALDPALDIHLQRISKLTDAERTEQLFDFRIADIAMGSGHFLVAAIDRIEEKFTTWLEENPTPGIKREFQYLKSASHKSLGDISETLEIEDSQLLRRMIARHCIYGVDLNPITVQLSQLSIWIHTFVPGLPLSLLDHNLIQGNSLVGVASLDEIRKKFKEGDGTLFEVDSDLLLGDAAQPLKELAKMSDASIKDIENAKHLIEIAKEKTLPTKYLCDLITAQPISKERALTGFIFENWQYQKKDISNSKALQNAKDILSEINPVHFPVSFPEVFTGYAQGFNVILGNPPWEAIKVEEQKFWARYFPGLRSKSQREFEEEKIRLYSSRGDLVKILKKEKLEQEQIRKIILSGNYPGIGKGDPDLYKAFSWRFLNLLSKKIGNIGIVMPRSLISANGSQEFRKYISKFSKNIDITLLQNTNKWIFDIEPRYTIALMSLSRSINNIGGIFLKGPFDSYEDFLKRVDDRYLPIKIDEIESWSEDCAFPVLPHPDSLGVFRQLKKSPWITTKESNDLIIKPRVELHATANKKLMDLESESKPQDFWPVFKGKSFDIWNPDQGDYYAWGDPKKIIPFLRDKELNRSLRENYDYKDHKIHAEKPRISFRLTTNRTNRRTLIVSLIPPNTFQQHSVQFLEFIKGDEYDEAFVLGCLSSIPLDWYARKFVEINFTFNYFNSLPLPRPSRNNPLWGRVVELSGRLACQDERFEEWGSKINISPKKLSLLEINYKICELDAVVALLYGLSKNQLIHIFETFHKGWDYHERLKEVLKFFNKHKI